jgi:hypothetical protein
MDHDTVRWSRPAGGTLPVGLAAAMGRTAAIGYTPRTRRISALMAGSTACMSPITA